MASRNYTDLFAWQKSMDLVEAVYEMTGLFPGEEMFGLTRQLRRVAVSIPSNIAEGQGRYTNGDFRRFLAIAHGSLREVETQTYIAGRLRYIDQAQQAAILSKCGEVGRLVRGLSNSLVEPPERGL